MQSSRPSRCISPFKVNLKGCFIDPSDDSIPTEERYQRGIKSLPDEQVISHLASNVERRSINHIKNMLDENRKLEAQRLADQSVIEKTDRIYKPTYTVEFERTGEVLVYSCDPLKHVAVYLKYPYVLYESLIPLTIWLYFVNPLELEWYWNTCNLLAANLLWIPRVWYWRSLQFRIQRMYLLRGGKAVKLETTTLAGDRNVSWVENYNFHPLTQDQKFFDDRDNAEFLSDEGQLKHELSCQLDDLTEMGVNTNDAIIYFHKAGVVHHPELFEAVCKGYNIDTSDYVINTAHNLRAREGNHNH